MTVLFSGQWRVAYGQCYVIDDPGSWFERVVEAHPVEGRLGADVPGVLFLKTALHTGPTTVEVTLSSGPPEDDGSEWASVEDGQLAVTSDDVALVAWAGELTVPLALPPGTYRVRYHCEPHHVDSSAELDALETGVPVGRSWLHLWPLDAAA